MAKVVNGKRNRQVGHSYERLWAKRFRDMGFSYCKTSRQASRLLDDSKIDLAFVPYNVQCKSVKANLKYNEVFNEMDEAIKKNFPPSDLVHSYPSIIAHKRGPKPEDEHVIMKAKDFLNLVEHTVKCENIINNLTSEVSKLEKQVIQLHEDNAGEDI